MTGPSLSIRRSMSKHYFYWNRLQNNRVNTHVACFSYTKAFISGLCDMRYFLSTQTCTLLFFYALQILEKRREKA